MLSASNDGYITYFRILRCARWPTAINLRIHTRLSASDESEQKAQQPGQHKPAQEHRPIPGIEA